MKPSFLKTLVAALLILVAVPSTAAPVDADAARARVSRLMNLRRAAPQPAATVMNLAYAEPSSSVAGQMDFYVFNAGDGSAFAIVAGDDRAVDILAYGEGSLDMDNLPCGLECLLEQFKEQMDWLAAHPDAQVEASGQQFAPTDGSVMPLLTCSWSQSAPYYNLCPTDEHGDHAVTGCIATAMAQVMYYWRFPKLLPAVEGYNYSCFVLEDLPGCTIDWDNMLDQYLGGYNETQATAVAVLMRYCGQACNMMYGVDGSGSYMSNQRRAIIRFGYNNAIGSRDRDWYAASSWTQMMRDELNAGRPILYTAQANGGGHAFVIDGWHNGLFHINWGWAGTGNGYFALDAFNVRGYGFNQSQAMLTNVQPGHGGGNNPVEDYDCELNGIYYKLDGDGAMVVSRGRGYQSYNGDVVIPDHITVGGESLAVTAVGDGAFMNCTGLHAVSMPATVKTIGRQAFRNCSALTRVEVPDGVTEIGEQAFAHCVSLEVVKIPATLVAVDYDAFEGCVEMEMVDISDVAPWCAVCFANNNSNPLYNARHLSLNGEEVTTLVIPSQVASVARSAFINCLSIRQLVIEEGVQSLERSSFANCDNLASLTFPSTLTAIGQMAFYECKALTALNLSNGLNSVGASAFYGCSALQDVTFSETVTAVGAQAFEECGSLEAVHIADLSSWCRIRFGDENANPLTCAGHLLMNGAPITHLVLPADIDTIYTGTFAGDMDLEQVDITGGISQIGDNAFLRCRNLKTLNLGDALTHIGAQAFKGCSSLTQVVIPDHVTTVGEGAFNNCSALQHIVFGESVTTIPKEVCDGCKSLDNVVIGSGVTSISSMAFYSCRNMTSVTCKAKDVPQLAGMVCFNNDVYANAILRVPLGTELNYGEAKYWTYFKNIVGVDMHEPLPGDVNEDGVVNITDINTVIDAILIDRYSTTLDVNGDGTVNITDINTVINLIMQ